MTQTKKRRRIGDSAETTVVLEQEQTTQEVQPQPEVVKEETSDNPYAEFYDKDGEFDWDAY
jgi:hypothetical protein